MMTVRIKRHCKRLNEITSSSRSRNNTIENNDKQKTVE